MRQRAFVAVMTLIVVTCLATSGSSQISGTDHDFSGDGWNSTGEICVVCHTPHNSMAEPNAPLWNHELTQADFQLYSSFTLHAVPEQPTGSSKLCLSCHDGTVALDAFGQQPGDPGNVLAPGPANLGADLTNDHPVSFLFDAALAVSDGGLHDPEVVASGLGGTIEEDMLFAGRLECASCHDPHSASFPNFLLKDNAGSALCLTCHDK